MIRLPRRLHGEPSFPMMIVGHGRVHHTHLPSARQRRLRQLAGVAPVEWGVLFVRDSRRRRWTLYSPDPDYAALFAPHAHTLQLTSDIVTTKFPAWGPGWRID